ncbi:hypothetical protein DBT_1925 [Dissulfuribacter thermophilus]|uniref:Uncharacterized protein n=1 Tax=Dissulfuribacter thermophilus TaxID=1156395 RepID=A0A1B9F3W2_9BACT|nr:hypothetical protein [Dissulfuribacter thermophilus]OCC14610.1 hypothetical protein DBT_1925 [Dissulfuribacter thermophilus]
MKVILFPTSYCKDLVRTALFPFIDSIITVIPTEKTPIINKDENSLLPNNNNSQSSVTVKELCPSPIGSNIETFEGLIRSYLAWAEHLGLGHAIQAKEFMKHSVEDPESITQLIKELKGNTDNEDLLQSRVFLELSYILDKEEDNLRRELNSLEKKEKSLKQLMGGPEEDNSESLDINTLLSWELPPISQLKRRLCAWYEILSGLKEPIAEAIPLGEGRETRDLLDGIYEGRCKCGPRELLTLWLHPDTKNDPQAIENIKKGLSELIEKVRSIDSQTKSSQEHRNCQARHPVDGHPENDEDSPLQDSIQTISKQIKDTWKRLQPEENTPLCLQLVWYQEATIWELIQEACKKDLLYSDGPLSQRLALFLI